MLLCRGLEELKLEGNQLVAMPASILQLRRLRQLKVTNNFMHPLFWKDAMADQTQVIQSLHMSDTLFDFFLGGGEGKGIFGGK